MIQFLLFVSLFYYCRQENLKLKKLVPGAVTSEPMAGQQQGGKQEVAKPEPAGTKMEMTIAQQVSCMVCDSDC